MVKAIRRITSAFSTQVGNADVPDFPKDYKLTSTFRTEVQKFPVPEYPKDHKLERNR